MKDGGPAFPMWTEDMPIVGSEGITIRDYFAAKAMQVVMESWGRKDSDSWDTCKPVMADISYEFADAMLAAREKGNE